MKLISIDIGILHLGLVAAEINEDYTIKEIHDCDLVDITSGCRLQNCKLHHDSCITDYMLHFFEEYREPLEEAELILVEQQPPGGLIAVQELIRFRYREKVMMLSPRSIHCHFGIQHLDYEKRKLSTERMAERELHRFKNYTFQERKHDIADAYCQLVYWSQIKNKEYLKMQINKRHRQDFKGLIRSMESFRFDSSKLEELYKPPGDTMDLET